MGIINDHFTDGIAVALKRLSGSNSSYIWQTPGFRILDKNKPTSILVHWFRLNDF